MRFFPFLQGKLLEQAVCPVLTMAVASEKLSSIRWVSGPVLALFRDQDSFKVTSPAGTLGQPQSKLHLLSHEAIQGQDPADRGQGSFCRALLLGELDGVGENSGAARARRPSEEGRARCQTWASTGPDPPQPITYTQMQFEPNRP